MINLNRIFVEHVIVSARDTFVIGSGGTDEGFKNVLFADVSLSH